MLALTFGCRMWSQKGAHSASESPPLSLAFHAASLAQNRIVASNVLFRLPALFAFL